MPIYDQLPVFKASYDLLLEVFLTVKNLTKEYKYTLGERLKEEVLELIIGIYRTNSRKDKLHMIRQAREEVEVIRLLVRLLFDLKQITLKRMVAVNERIELVSKQLAGWHKALEKKQEYNNKGPESSHATAGLSAPD